MLTEKDYCDYETCVALKELGIGWEDVPEKWAKRYFFIRIPLYDAQKWLREEKGIGITIFHGYYHGTMELYYQVEIYNTEHWITTFGEYKDWNVALLEGIKETVKLLKEEK